MRAVTHPCPKAAGLKPITPMSTASEVRRVFGRREDAMNPKAWFMYCAHYCEKGLNEKFSGTKCRLSVVNRRFCQASGLDATGKNARSAWPRPLGGFPQLRRLRAPFPKREQAPALHTLARAASPSAACHAERLECASLLAPLDVARIVLPSRISVRRIWTSARCP